MESGKKDVIYKYIRNLGDDTLLEFINFIYSCGYVDACNGNDEYEEFQDLLERIYKNVTK